MIEYLALQTKILDKTRNKRNKISKKLHFKQRKIPLNV